MTAGVMMRVPAARLQMGLDQRKPIRSHQASHLPQKMSAAVQQTPGYFQGAVHLVAMMFHGRVNDMFDSTNTLTKPRSVFPLISWLLLFLERLINKTSQH